MNAAPERRSGPAPSQIIALWILAFAAAAAGLYFASTLSLWVLCSFFIFALVEPWLEKLERRGVPPVLAGLILIGGFALALVMLGTLLYQFSPEIGEVFKTYRNTLLKLYKNLSSFIDQTFRSGPISPQTGDATPVTIVDHSPLQNPIGASLLNGVTGAISTLGYAALCPVLAFFMVTERRLLGAALARFAARPEELPRAWREICASTAAFFLGNLLLAAACFPAFALLFGLFGVRNTLLLAILASFFNLVPFLGAVLASALPFLELASEHPIRWPAIFGVISICALIHFTVANLVTPRILGSRLQLNATCSTIVLIAFGHLWGAVGLLLAIPLTAVIKILFEHAESPVLQKFAGLMARRSR